MKRFLALICAILMLFILFPININVYADDLDVDMSIQTEVSEYALSFADEVRLQYVWGGKGGRTITLEEAMANHEQWAPGHEYTEDGTDCSGFVTGIYNMHFHLNSCGNTATTGIDSTKVKYVSKEEAVPGDVILFWGEGWSGGPTHAAIYLGGNLMIHTCTSKGETGTRWGNTGGTNKTYPHISVIDETYARYCRMVDDVSKLGKPVGYSRETGEDNPTYRAESGIPYEEYLDGMPRGLSTFQDYQKFLEFATTDNLTVHEFFGITEIRNGIDSQKIDMIGTICSGLGVVLMVYAFLLIAAFIFDKANTLFDMSLVSVLTLGFVNIDFDNIGKAGRRSFLIRVCIAILIGGLLATNLLTLLLYKLVY